MTTTEGGAGSPVRSAPDGDGTTPGIALSPPAGGAPATLEAALAELRLGVGRVADALLALETSPELALLRDASALRGRSAELAAAAVAAADSLWPRYPLLTAAVEEAGAALADGDEAGAAARLGPRGIALHGGSTTSPASLLVALERDAATATAAVHEVAEAWRVVFPRLDAARRELARLGAAADALDVEDDPDLAAAGRIVEHLASTVAADPLAIDPSPAESALARAAARIDVLERRRLGLPERLAAAAAELDELRTTIAEASAALERSRSRILAPVGLLQVPDRGVVDGDDRSLAPWLGRLRALADDGAWEPASAGLDQWERVSDGWLDNARAALEANRAPVRRRDELRGLLAAYRAKAVGIGRAEDLSLVAPRRAADEALRRRPCDLGEATRLVTAYRDAVNAVLAGDGAGAT